MAIRRRCPAFAFLILGILAFVAAPSASAECSDAHVKRLAKEGNTIASIARTCEMEAEEVQSILEDEGTDGGGGGGGGGGLPAGAPIGQCGCWGPVDPNLRQPQSQCKSGYAQPSMCPVQCPAGGYAWRGVCT